MLYLCGIVGDLNGALADWGILDTFGLASFNFDTARIDSIYFFGSEINCGLEIGWGISWCPCPYLNRFFCWSLLDKSDASLMASSIFTLLFLYAMDCSRVMALSVDVCI